MEERMECYHEKYLQDKTEAQNERGHLEEKFEKDVDQLREKLDRAKERTRKA
jgi:hypothetical protein